MTMKPSMLSLVLAFLAVPVFQTPSSALAPARASEVPAEIAAGYERLARSMREEEMREFMDMFSLEYVHVAPDGRSRDRGPWRRLWLENFRKLDYPLVLARIERVASSDEDRIVLEVRIVEVTRRRGEDEFLVREYLVEDIWVHEEDSWRLVYREEKEKSDESRVT